MSEPQQPSLDETQKQRRYVMSRDIACALLPYTYRERPEIIAAMSVSIADALLTLLEDSPK